MLVPAVAGVVPPLPGMPATAAPRAAVPRGVVLLPWDMAAVGASGPGESSPGMCPAVAAFVPAIPCADVTAGAVGASAGAATPGTAAFPAPAWPRWPLPEGSVGVAGLLAVGLLAGVVA